MEDKYFITTDGQLTHPYQFSYDAPTEMFENPLQEILRIFVRGGIIDVKAKFSLMLNGHAVNTAIMVRPVESTWLFHSHKTLHELQQFLNQSFRQEFSYTISEMKLQENNVLFAYRDAGLRDMDEELKEAIDIEDIDK